MGWSFPQSPPTLSLALVEVPFLFFLLFGGFHDTLSGSNNTSSGGIPPRCPTRKNLRLRWGTPKNWLSSTRQHHPYPHFSSVSRMIPKSLPPRLDNKPGTFSTKSHLGRATETSLTNSCHRELLSPSKPLLSPATDRSWQGNPPQNKSACGSSFASTSHISFHLGVSAQCLLKICVALLSHSTCPLHSHPALSNPKSNPPTPAKKDINVGLYPHLFLLIATILMSPTPYLKEKVTPNCNNH